MSNKKPADHEVVEVQGTATDPVEASEPSDDAQAEAEAARAHAEGN